MSHDPSGPARIAAWVAQAYPELSPAFLEDARAAEPALAAGIAACRLDTGHQIPPAAATEAWAARATAAGARIELGRAVYACRRRAPTRPRRSGTVDAGARVKPIWGVTVQVRLDQPPRHALEEAVIEELVTMAGEVPPAFAAVTAGGVTTIGATFLADEPDHRAVAPTLLERARAYPPAQPSRPSSSAAGPAHAPCRRTATR